MYVVTQVHLCKYINKSSKQPLNFAEIKKYIKFAPCLRIDRQYMVDVAQLVRASDCGSEGRGFEAHLPPVKGSFLSILRETPFFD